jgi:hypothetical protein
VHEHAPAGDGVVARATSWTRAREALVLPRRPARGGAGRVAEGAARVVEGGGGRAEQLDVQRLLLRLEGVRQFEQQARDVRGQGLVARERLVRRQPLLDARHSWRGQGRVAVFRLEEAGQTGDGCFRRWRPVVVLERIVPQREPRERLSIRDRVQVLVLPSNISEAAGRDASLLTSLSTCSATVCYHALISARSTRFSSSPGGGTPSADFGDSALAASTHARCRGAWMQAKKSAA